MPDQPQRDPLELLTTAQLARLWRCDPSTVSRMAARGELPCIRIGRLLRFQRAALERYITNNPGARPGLLSANPPDLGRGAGLQG